MNLKKLLFCFVLIVLFFGRFKRKIFAQKCEWSIGNDGWVFSKGEGEREKEKFFAIGTWHVPGYKFTKLKEINEKEYRKKASVFEEKTNPFNMVFVTPGYEKDYMKNKIHILNPFSPILNNYLDRIDSLPKGRDKDYYRAQYMKKLVNDDKFEKYLNSEIKNILINLPNDKYVYSHIDEISLGGIGKWYIPPSMGGKICERVKKYDQNALVFVDLMGHCKGSTYFFERNYLKNYGDLPLNPPYELLTGVEQNCKNPLLGFFVAYNGKPVYKFFDGIYSYVEYNIDTLKSIWYENTKLTAKAYKNSGDVFGINAFRDFFNYPILAGITVDAIKDGLGDKTPVWLYFDGNGYAKPEKMLAKEYVNIVKCQIYTAIIHGATGILFWNDWKKEPDVFEFLLPMLKELENDIEIIKLKTVRKEMNNNIHVMVKNNGEKGKYFIATNTSKIEKRVIDCPDGGTKELKPLEVFITNYQ